MAQDWTEKVRMETERGMELFRAHPERYGNSENRYKAEALISVLRHILKGSYEPAALPSQHLFATGGGSRGPYISMPFLCLAVGRRLHYPLKLASAGDRLRLRWEGEEHFDLDWQSFNAPLEFQERTGEKPFPNFPRDLGEDHSRSPAYLLSSADELSMLLNARGACWESHGKNWRFITFAVINLTFRESWWEVAVWPGLRRPAWMQARRGMKSGCSRQPLKVGAAC